MKEFSHVVKDELGIHARPAGMLVKLVKNYESNIEITKGERTVGAGQLLKLMSLGVKCGEEVRITVDGPDEEAAYEGVKKFFEENL